jgi:hypothetical protein
LASAGAGAGAAASSSPSALGFNPQFPILSCLPSLPTRSADEGDDDDKEMMHAGRRRELRSVCVGATAGRRRFISRPPSTDQRCSSELRYHQRCFCCVRELVWLLTKYYTPSSLITKPAK